LHDELARQCHDLEPGFHRLLLDAGRLSLTLCVGELASVLAHQDMQADSLLLAPHTPGWDKWQIKALARCCRRGARLLFGGPALPAAGLLADAGFTDTQELAPGTWQAVYDPRWQLRSRPPARGADAQVAGAKPTASAGRCAVIGAGMAGASVAHALALRGFQVDVYDAQPHPAGGASGLPVGLVVPHHSADDSPRSRLSRHGTRLMLQHASRLLQTGHDWKPGGVMELAVQQDGLTEAEAELLSHPMAAGGTPGLWHAQAAWIKPATLVQQWLAQPGIQFHGQAGVHTLEQTAEGWRLCDARGQELGHAGQVVLANAHGCVELVLRLAKRLARAPADALPPAFSWVPDVLDKLQAMQHMHGTLSHGPCPAAAAALPALPVFPAFPVNGHGSFVSGVPTPEGLCWYAGATFRSDAGLLARLADEHAANLRKLQALLPAVAHVLAPQFGSTQVQAWQGSRCVSHDRLPLVGPLQDAPVPTLWLCAGMGARGLSFSALCAELLAAALCGEPLPVESNLARSLSTRRPRRGLKATHTRGLRP
jgi:tRNA 5-methylaminomethyl-2-thiouridine biosynthesis bifunctional protein